MARIKVEKQEYDENNIETLLHDSLKVEETVPGDDFTSKVMNKIKNDAEFDSSYDLNMVDDMLESLPYQDIVAPKADFTSSVMARIKEGKKVYNEDNIEELLHSLNKHVIKMPAKDFTQKVMDKINAEEDEDNIISFEKVSKKFLIGSAIVAAAAILLALNLFSSYDPSMAEFMVTDYFNTGLY